MNNKQPTFYCVLTFDAVVEDFVIEGIFTLRSDAVTFAGTFNPNFKDDDKDSSGGTCGANGGSVFVTLQTRRAVISMLLSERLGQLYEPLKKIAGIIDEVSNG
jgi:hypothetical protein